MKESLGRYKIIKEIGRGAMGVVYQGYDPKIDRTVALKTIRKDRLADSRDVENLIMRFKREVRATGKLVHPNIIVIYDTGEDEETAYIAMEYIDGDTLDNLIQKGVRFSIETIVNIIDQICQGLEFTHRRGIVHRDLKPSNIMLVEGEQVKITDFGISKAVGAASSPLTQAGVLLGTPSYMSPEQVAGATIDGRSDLFSLGIMLYQLLTGEKAFSGDTIPTLLFNIVHKEPPLPSQIDPHIPPFFDEVIAKALAKRPEDRYQTAKDFADDVKRAYRGERVKKAAAPDLTATVTTAVAETPYPKSKRFWLATGIGLLLLAMVIGGYYWMHRTPMPSGEEEYARTKFPEKSGPVVEKESIGPAPPSLEERGEPQPVITVAKVVLKSDPPDAQVYLDGKRLEALTPTVIEKVTVGEKHTVRVEKQGFKPWSGTVEPKSEESLTVEAALTRMVSNVIVRSTPSGASVLLDGKRLEALTPTVIEKVTVGEKHTVRVEKQGFKPWSGTVEPKSEKALTVEMSLVRMRSTIVVRSTPSGALVFLDGQQLSGSTPMEIRDVSPDESHKIQVTKKDYETVVETLTLKADEQREVKVRLQPLLGQIGISSAPSGARVYLNGKAMGLSTPARLSRLSPGSYTVRLEKNGYKAWEEKVVVKASEPVDLQGVKLEAAVGKLNLLVSPWADVYYMGKKLGTTPLANIPFQEGTHKLTLKNQPLKIEKQITIRIVADQTTKTRVDLTKEMKGKLNLRVTPWAHVYIDGKPVGTTPLKPLELMAGAHEVHLKNDALKVERSFTVMIKANEIVSKEVNLLK